MKPNYDGQGVTLWHGDCLDVLATLPDCSVDAVCTDPPYGLEFMGKEWDKFDRKGPASFENLGPDQWETTDTRFVNSTSPYLDKPRHSTMGPRAMAAFQQWCEQWAAECLRVLKPGGHLLAFGGSRTYHRLTSGVEDAGFEIRDCITWHFATGFPKSLDVSKAIDRAAGVEREVVGRYQPPNGKAWNLANDESVPGSHGQTMGEFARRSESMNVTAPATDAARQWQGWGTALKPATEFIVVARKPLTGTVAANVQAWSTGALNIDATRIEGAPRPLMARIPSVDRRGVEFTPEGSTSTGETTTAGRWPANVIFDETQAARLDEQSGESASNLRSPTGRLVLGNSSSVAQEGGSVVDRTERGHTDNGGASRFFFIARKDDQPCPSTSTASTAEAPSSHPSELDGSAPNGAATSEPPATEKPMDSPPISAMPSESRPSGVSSTRTQRSGSASSPDSRLDGHSPTPSPANSAASLEPTGTTTTTTSLSSSDGCAAPATSATTSSSKGLGATALGIDGPYDRFMFVAKADAGERPRVPKQGAGQGRVIEGASGKVRECKVCGNRTIRSGETEPACGHGDFAFVPTKAREEHVAHPTVKPLALMRHLVRLVTPPGGTVLEPFAGSGTTVEACLLEGFRCIAIEKTDEYLPLILARIHRQRDPVEAIRLAGDDLGLFDLDFGEGA